MWNSHFQGLGDEAAELQLQRRCRELDISLDAFSALQYVGTRTRTPTDFKNLLVTVKTQLRNINVRSPRRPAVVFSALKVGAIKEIITYFPPVKIFEGKSVTLFDLFQVLNDKFSGDIEKSVPSTFPDQYFTCIAVCLSCG